MAERRPTLTASARVGVRNHGRGGRKPAARSNKRKHRSKKESGLVWKGLDNVPRAAGAPTEGEAMMHEASPCLTNSCLTN